jgi:NTP pyrophosphatase (non-canonical NTP hydrolase)
MRGNDYQEFTLETAIYPGVGSGEIGALSYCALGLVGEAGEVADKIKKLIRDGDQSVSPESIIKELSDVCWYLARLSNELGVDLEDLFAMNVRKLLDRKKRGVLGGSGDDR